MYNYDYKTFDEIKKVLDPNVLHTTEHQMERTQTDYYFSPDEEIKDDYIHTELWQWDEKNNGGRPFKYRINRHGFRSQHFENYNRLDKNILFGGCSNTSGIGLPEELVWPSILTAKIKEKMPYENIQAYNVAVGGSSIPYIFKNVLAFLRKNDGVDYVFILLPGFDRHVAFDEENKPKMFKKIVMMPPEAENFKYKFVKRFVKSYVAEEAIFLQLPLIKAIEDICELKNIKLIWSTWRPEDQELYKAYGFNHYCDINPNILNYQYGGPGDYEYKTLARDDQHPGSDWMNGVANTFFEATFNGE